MKLSRAGSTPRATKSLMYAFAPEDGISSRRLVEMLDDLGFEGQLWMVEGDPLVVADERPYDAVTIAAMWLRRWGVRPLERWLAQNPDIVLERRSETGTAVRPDGPWTRSSTDIVPRSRRPSGRTMRMCAFITVMSDGKIDVKVGELKPDADGPIADRARQIAGPMCLLVLVFAMVRDRTFITGMAAAPVTSELPLRSIVLRCTPSAPPRCTLDGTVAAFRVPFQCAPEVCDQRQNRPRPTHRDRPRSATFAPFRDAPQGLRASAFHVCE